LVCLILYIVTYLLTYLRMYVLTVFGEPSSSYVVRYGDRLFLVSNSCLFIGGDGRRFDAGWFYVFRYRRRRRLRLLTLHNAS